MLLWQSGQLQLALGCKSVDVRCNSFYPVSASLSPRLCSSRRPKLWFLCGSRGEESPLLSRGWGGRHLPRYQRIMLLLVFHPLVIRYYSGAQILPMLHSSSTEWGGGGAHIYHDIKESCSWNVLIHHSSGTTQVILRDYSGNTRVLLF